MKAQELRIGNYAHRVYDSPRNPEDVETIIIGAISDISETYVCENDNIGSLKELRPIPLTEEWLVKFRFNGWDLGDYTIILTNGNFFTIDCRKPIAKNIKHVHQLQNLYFSLTQKELIIKTK
jgi:hypothetical protein